MRIRINTLALLLGIALLSGFLTYCSHGNCLKQGNCYLRHLGCGLHRQECECVAWECDEGYVKVGADRQELCAPRN